MGLLGNRLEDKGRDLFIFIFLVQTLAQSLAQRRSPTISFISYQMNEWMTKRKKASQATEKEQ